MATKACSMCGEVKKLDDFPICPTMKLKRNSWCRDCKRAYQREWRKKNKDKCQEYTAKWNAKNPEKLKIYRRSNYIKGKKNQPDAKVCFICDSGGQLEHHHPDYKQEKLTVMLCVRCHRRFHAIKRMETCTEAL